MSRSPYSGRPARAFWSSGVVGASPFASEMYRPKFQISRETSVFTAGSCFAQHVGAAMRAAGLKLIDEEPALRGLPPEIAKQFGYGLYSARFGNIYTIRQFLQLVEELGRPDARAVVWEKDGRFWDAMRPGVEPDGLESPDHVIEMRNEHLLKLGAALEQAEVMVFTMGLTEAWEHIPTGRVFPTAPGTIAGSFDPDEYRFVNYSVEDILRDFKKLDDDLRSVNPGLKWILTVSPVPLAATASEHHVLPATMRSKAVLRVVCDILSEGSDRIDYFPSYEMVTSPGHEFSPFEPDLRSVRSDIVQSIMTSFLAAHGLASEDLPDVAAQTVLTEHRDDLICEEILLDAFGPEATK